MTPELTREHITGLLADEVVVCLLDGPHLSVQGQQVPVPEGCQRLVALLALQNGKMLRRRAAGHLWPDTGEARAAGNLRSVLWRLRKYGHGVVDADKSAVWIRSGVGTDVAWVKDWASHITGGKARLEDFDVRWWHPEIVDLLPGWDDDWIVYERESVRQQVLHALECLASTLVAAGRYGEGIRAALLAVESEPLRESAQRRLVQAHIAEGNIGEALRVIETYRSLLKQELGIQPSAQMLSLVGNGQ